MENLKTKVFEALGTASMCWTETPKGVFDSTECQKIGDALWEAIEKKQNEVNSKPWLGNATTAELLAELTARAEIHGYAKYKTTMSSEEYDGMAKVVLVEEKGE